MAGLARVRELEQRQAELHELNEAEAREREEKKKAEEARKITELAGAERPSSVDSVGGPPDPAIDFSFDPADPL
ncbi:hypothetical protein ACEPPN_013576 [Leptodophora sp. 'Broadleaf-Isolate-01']